MSKDETGSGLLSKLVKFVRNPVTSWSELDTVQAEKDDAVNKQLLKEMMERKRRNDFVRKREFDMLRKLRQREAVEGQSQDPAGRPSFFQSSMISPDDRASTIKKIDEIEAQMSMQWWRNKEQGAVGNTLNPAAMGHGAEAVTQAPQVAQAAQAPAGQPLAYEPTQPIEPASTARVAELMLDPTLNLSEDRATQRTEAGELAPMDREYHSGMSGLSPFTPASSSVAKATAEPEMTVHDAELEEAAILFANGDDAGAEAGLLELLAPGALRVDHVDTWLTLFDLYRATGEQEKFETAALKFVKRFDRSAPQWFCLPDMMKALAGPGEQAAHSASSDWICPSAVGLQTVAALNAAMARRAMPWRLDWSNLKTIDVSALEPLYKVFSNWVTQPVQLQFLGAAQLQKILLGATPSGERSTDQAWWLLRMQALRAMHLPDDFELTALDFCVTYEVSPPAWESARCVCTLLDAQGNAMESQAIISEPVHSTLNPMLDGPDSSLGQQNSQMSHHLFSVELSGYVQGDAIGVLDALEAKLTGASMVQISCTKLIRVDFSAAGMLLNWVSARQVEHRPVKFTEVNRLVAAFFNVIGITEYARVVVRVD
ncbi:MAG: STAS domain-containing protein [Pseudomonadota bacterium]|nr:STAS domain-containing protein [Pseudomonadota bacterium]